MKLTKVFLKADKYLLKLHSTFAEMPEHEFSKEQVFLLCRLAEKFKSLTDRLWNKVNGNKR